MEECPHCKSIDGYYEKRIVSYCQYFDFEGEIIDASEFQKVRGGKNKYCENCNRDITKHFESKEK